MFKWLMNIFKSKKTDVAPSATKPNSPTTTGAVIGGTQTVTDTSPQQPTAVVSPETPATNPPEEIAQTIEPSSFFSPPSSEGSAYVQDPQSSETVAQAPEGQPSAPVTSSEDSSLNNFGDVQKPPASSSETDNQPRPPAENSGGDGDTNNQAGSSGSV